MEGEFSGFRESDKSQRHELGQIKDSICSVFLPGAVEASQSLTQEVAGSNNLFKCNIFCR